MLKMKLLLIPKDSIEQIETEYEISELEKTNIDLKQKLEEINKENETLERKTKH